MPSAGRTKRDEQQTLVAEVYDTCYSERSAASDKSLHNSIGALSQPIEGCPVKNPRCINVARDGVDVTRSDAKHCRTCHLSTPKMFAEPVLRAGEGLKALKFLCCLNSTADAARNG